MILPALLFLTIIIPMPGERGHFNVLIFLTTYSSSNEVLKMSGGLDEPGAPVWDITLCLLLSWVLCVSYYNIHVPGERGRSNVLIIHF